jgi:hypothetical protein
MVTPGVSSKAGRTGTQVGSFVNLLTLKATLGGRIGLEPLDADRLLAVDTDPIAPLSDPDQSGVDVTDLLDMAVDAGQIEVHQKIGYRRFFCVMDLSGQFLVAV